MRFTRFTWRAALTIVLAIGILFALSLDASAQCSMCRAALSGAANARFQQSFNTAVLVLLLPPVSIFCSIFIILRKHGKGGSNEDPDRNNGDQ
jgi:hypothetical protein